MTRRRGGRDHPASGEGDRAVVRRLRRGVSGWRGYERETGPVSATVRILGVLGSHRAGEVWFIPTGDSATEFFRVVVPGWVRPSRWEVLDCYWLAYRAHLLDAPGTPGAVAATLAWVCGGSTGPITLRPEQPVTRELVQAEIYAAWAVGYEDLAVSLRSRCLALGVPYYSAAEVSMAWAERVWRTLRWLRGAVPPEGVKPPVTLPARREDGGVVTVEELYTAELGRDVARRFDSPEQRQELRLQLEQAAARSRELARIVAATKRSVGLAA